MTKERKGHHAQGLHRRHHRAGACYESDHLIGDAYKDFIVKDLEQWRAVAKAANIKIEN
jgi:hypothetical protein